MLETKQIADNGERFGLPTALHVVGSPIGFIANVHCAAAIARFVALKHHAPWARPTLLPLIVRETHPFMHYMLKRRGVFTSTVERALAGVDALDADDKHGSRSC